MGSREVASREMPPYYSVIVAVQQEVDRLFDSIKDRFLNKRGQRAFLVGAHGMLPQPGKPAEILGVEIITTQGYKPMPCYYVRYPDGQTSHIRISDSDVNIYKIISEDDVAAGRIPEVAH